MSRKISTAKSSNGKFTVSLNAIVTKPSHKWHNRQVEIVLLHRILPAALVGLSYELKIDRMRTAKGIKTKGVYLDRVETKHLQPVRAA